MWIGIGLWNWLRFGVCCSDFCFHYIHIDQQLRQHAGSTHNVTKLQTTVGAAYGVVLQLNLGDDIFLTGILFLLDLGIKRGVPLPRILVNLLFDSIYPLEQVGIALNHQISLVFHVLPIEILHLLILRFHLLIIVYRVAVEQLQIGIMNQVELLHRCADKLQFVLYVHEVVFLIAYLTHIDVDEMDVSFNLLHRLAKLLILIISEEGAGCAEVVILSNRSCIPAQYLLGSNRPAEDALTLIVVANLVVHLMNLCHGKRLDGCYQFKVVHVVADIVTCQLLIATVFQRINNVAFFVICQTLGDGLERCSLEIATVGKRILGTVLLP